MNFEKIYVLDTNIILDDAHNIIKIGQNGKNLIVLPETVIDELDSKKTGFAEINFQAREFGRILSEAQVIETSSTITDDLVTVTNTRVEVNNITIDIVSLSDYKLNGVDTSIINDRKIINVAKLISSINSQNTFFMSNDIMCRTRAIAENIQVTSLSSNKESLTGNFIKKIEVESSSFNVMENKRIKEFDKDYIPENYCYHFLAEDGNEKLAYIINGKINFIEEDELRKNSVKPLNSGQLFAMAGMLDERINICMIEALAGSGKTLLALASGMKMVRQGKYDKIIYIRNSVESTDKAEEVGFLPGNEEKFAIYNYPLYDTLEFIAQKDMKKRDNSQSQESIDAKVQELVDKYNIETMWPGSIRGRTISNAYVIVDEVQNFSRTSLQTVLSRMDANSKVICIGSNRQIDHPYINKYTNGLSVLIKALKEVPVENQIVMFGTELNKVVRGPITAWTERIFEK